MATIPSKEELASIVLHKTRQHSVEYSDHDITNPKLRRKLSKRVLRSCKQEYKHVPSQKWAEALELLCS